MEVRATAPPHRRWRRVVSALSLALAAASGACSGDPAGPGTGQEEAAVRIAANVSGTPINTLVVEVSASDFPQPLVFNLQASNGTASGTLKFPAGPARTITVRAFDTSGAITHQGSVTLNVSQGQNPPVNVPLTAQNGHVPITVSIGSVSVVVNPASATVGAGATVQLGATVTDAGGQAVNEPVSWATLNPSIATVDANGLVTGHAAGTVQIVATYAGVGGASLVTVQ